MYVTLLFRKKSYFIINTDFLILNSVKWVGLFSVALVGLVNINYILLLSNIFIYLKYMKYMI